jgi:hypothetical protein
VLNGPPSKILAAILACIGAPMAWLAVRHAAGYVPRTFRLMNSDLTGMTLVAGAAAGMALLLSFAGIALSAAWSIAAGFAQLALVPEYMDKLRGMLPLDLRVQLALGAAAGIALTALEVLSILLPEALVARVMDCSCVEAATQVDEWASGKLDEKDEEAGESEEEEEEEDEAKGGDVEKGAKPAAAAARKVVVKA